MKSTMVLIDELKSTNHPLVRASKLGRYISQSLLNKSINLYEAYLINQCHLDKLFLIKIGHHILQILENGVSLRNLERDEMNIDP